jgi:SAM-dependent methyltransferase
MNAFTHGVVRATSETFELSGPVLEVGSYQVVPGQGDLRPFFPERDYVGLDVRAGPGVDVVADVETLPYPDASFGTVVAMSAFEHVPRFWKGFEEASRVLRPGGALLVSCPFYFHLHDHPRDYWRFSPDALTLLLETYPDKIVGWHGPRSRPAEVWAVAFREGRPPLTVECHRRYQQALARHARMPLPWSRWLRLRLGALLFGRGHFAPYLDRDRWQTRCLSSPVAARQAARATQEARSREGALA